MGSLEGKRGVILGIANKNSIAWAIAKAMDAEGASLAFNFLNDRMEPKVRKLTETLPDSPTMICDVTKDEEIDAFFAAVSDAFGGKLDFLVHSLAFANREDMESDFSATGIEGFRVALEVSAYSLLPVARATSAKMPDGGSILTLTFHAADKVYPGYNVMGVAKAALENEMKQLAAEYGRRGIRVNAISAGPLNTLAARGISGFTNMQRVHAERSPLGRNITQDEVGAAAAFLSSPLASGITGHVLYVDAGYNVMGV